MTEFIILILKTFAICSLVFSGLMIALAYYAYRKTWNDYVERDRKPW